MFIASFPLQFILILNESVINFTETNDKFMILESDHSLTCKVTIDIIGQINSAQFWSCSKGQQIHRPKINIDNNICFSLLCVNSGNN